MLHKSFWKTMDGIDKNINGFLMNWFMNKYELSRRLFKSDGAKDLNQKLVNILSLYQFLKDKFMILFLFISYSTIFDDSSI